MQQFYHMIHAAQAVSKTSAPVLAGNSVAAHALRQMVSLAAKSSCPVMLSGPAGSGFHDIAREIHAQSALADEVYVDTSNQRMAEDHFAIRWNGTMFLGNIANLSLQVQSALVQWMDSDDGQNVRVICTLVDGTREDQVLSPLKKKLAALTLPFPHIAQRKPDIPAILQRLWASSVVSVPPIFDRTAWTQLLAYGWPGHFDEIQNFAEKASRHHGGRNVTSDHIRKLLGEKVACALDRPDFNLKSYLAQEEKLFLIEALLKSRGVVQDAASLAGVNRTTFLAKMKRHGLARA